MKKKYIAKSSSDSNSKAIRSTKINKTKILGISELVSGPRLNLIFQENIFSLRNYELDRTTAFLCLSIIHSLDNELLSECYCIIYYI